MKIVFDIGGSSLRVALAEGRALREVKKAATPRTPREGIETLALLIERLAEDVAIESIAGGIAGVVKDGVLVAAPNLPGWEGTPLARVLAERFHAPVHVLNDTACAALGEAVLGAGRGARIVAHVRVGTGVGAACVADGKLEPHALGVEPGHQVIDFASGRTLEMLAGGAALEARYGGSARMLPHEAYAEATPALAAGVWNAIVHWSPDVLVLGGSLVDDASGFRVGEVRAAVRVLQRVLPALPEIRRATLGDEAGLYGASLL